MKHLMTVLCILLCAVLFICFICTHEAAALDNAVATIKAVNGAASVVRQEKVIAAKTNEGVLRGDMLKTGPDGSLGVMFKDNTLMSLGPNSEIIIDEFLFSPAQGKLSLVTRMLKGTAACVSGIIAKLSPQSVRFETPVATVGTRGTEFLVQIENE